MCQTFGTKLMNRVFICITFCLFSTVSLSMDISQFLKSPQNYSNELSAKELSLTNLEIEDLGTVSLRLKSFKVYASDAQVVVHSEHDTNIMTMPNNKYFIGHINEMDNSRVFIGFLENGEISGFVKADNQPLKELQQLQNNHFKLKVSDYNKASVTDSREWNPKDYLELPDDVVEQRQQKPTNNRSSIDYELTLAIETDYEFYKKFPNKTAAINYISGLIGYISTIYYSEVKTYILLGEVNIWITSNDPWDATRSDCALYEVGKYWNDNRQHVNRATTHFMSGKNFGGGIAWLSVLCQNPFNTDISAASCPGLTPTTSNYGGAYGVTGSLSGGFNAGNPKIGWDLLGISHEIGHNFGSSHTHCYAGIGGNSNPVDKCYNGETGTGCFTGTKELPGPKGVGSGTIMSYCHLLNGGYSDITLTFGKDHSYGVQPQRVPNAMREHVENKAYYQPQCIRPAANDLIFMNGFD